MLTSPRQYLLKSRVAEVLLDHPSEWLSSADIVQYIRNKHRRCVNVNRVAHSVRLFYYYPEMISGFSLEERKRERGSEYNLYRVVPEG